MSDAAAAKKAILAGAFTPSGIEVPDQFMTDGGTYLERASMDRIRSAVVAYRDQHEDAAPDHWSQFRGFLTSLPWLKKVASSIHARSYAGVEFTLPLSEVDQAKSSPESWLTPEERTEAAVVLIQDALIWMIARLVQFERCLAAYERRTGRESRS